MGREQKVAYRLGRHGFRAIRLIENIPYGKKIPQRLRHLFFVNGDEPVMHPISGERLFRCGTGLRNFIFVVRKGQIFAASMNVEGCAQMAYGHGRTLDVPAGPARSPGTLPGRLPGFGRFP